MQTLLDIERTTGLTEGNIFQGELSLEQLFNRHGPRLCQVPHPGPRPVAVRFGDPPGWWTGGANGRIAALEVLRARGRKAA